MIGTEQAPSGATAVSPASRMESWAASPVRQMWLLLPLAAIPRLWAAWFDHGVYWPDEIYQTLEQAHRLVFGVGYVPWEFQDGARPWLIPGVVAGIWRVASLVGVDDPLVLVSLAKTAVALLSVGGIWAAMRLAGRFAGAPASLVTGVLLVAFPLSVMLGARVTNDTVTASLNVFAVLLVVGSGSGRLRAGGAVAALSVYLRNQNALVAGGLLLVLLAKGRWSEARNYVVGAGAALMGAGVFDWVTWGRPFHSFLVYLRFQFLIAPAMGSVDTPWWGHLQAFWSSTGVAVVVIGLGVLLAARRVPGLALLTLGYVAVHSAIGHKEFRFMMPIVPLGIAVAGIGMAGALERLAASGGRSVDTVKARVIAGALLVAVPSALAMGWKSAHAEFGEYGLYRGTRLENQSPWRHEQEINLLLRDAGRREDLCGLASVAGRNIVQNGGYTYLHRDVPIIGLWNKPEQRFDPVAIGAANYLMTSAEDAVPAGYEEVGTRGAFVLHRRESGCRALGGPDRRLLTRPF